MCSKTKKYYASIKIITIQDCNKETKNERRVLFMIAVKFDNYVSKKICIIQMKSNSFAFIILSECVTRVLIVLDFVIWTY